MTDLDDFKKTDLVDDVLAAHVNKLQAASMQSGFGNFETLTATRELVDNDTAYQVFTLAAAAQDVELPALNTAANHIFLIMNDASSSYAATVKTFSGAATVATLAAGEASLFVADDGTWAQIGGGGGGTPSAQTVTTADVTGVSGNEYNCTIAGLTADRNLTLPVPNAAGEEIRINILDGDDTYKLGIIGAATVTINGGSAATRWLYMQRKGETITLRSTSITNWNVIFEDINVTSYILSDGASSAQSISTIAYTKITTPLDSVVNDQQGWWTGGGTRRFDLPAGIYTFTGAAGLDGVSDQNTCRFVLYKNGAFNQFIARASQSGTDVLVLTGACIEESDGNDYFELYILSTDGSYDVLALAGYAAFGVTRSSL
jgi:hypothetical protein